MQAGLLQHSVDSELRRRLDAVFNPFARTSSPGCSVAIAVRGRTIYRAGFGMASLESARVITTATSMPIGSVTKQFTCAALLLLAADKTLSLDDTLAAWLPDLRGTQGRPTLRQVMTHSGGIRDYLDHCVFNGYATLPVGAPLALQMRQEHLNFEPGTDVSYSNGGYLLLSAVVEQASGMPFQTFLRRRLFEPLGMWSTRAARHGDASGENAATLYLSSGKEPDHWQVAKPLAEELLGDGGMVSTVDDMLRWAAHLRTSTGPISLATLTQPTVLDNGAASTYGLGVISDAWRGALIVNHIGGLPGANSILATLPEHELDLVLLFNRNVAVLDVVHQVVESMVGDTLARPVPPPRSEDHVAVLGTYFSQDRGFLFTLADSDGDLTLGTFGGTPQPLQCTDPLDGALPFAAEVGIGDIRLRAGHAEAGSMRTIDYLAAGTWHTAARLAAESHSIEEFVSSTRGSFYSDAFAASLSFNLEAQRLVVRLEGEFGSAVCAGELVASDLVRFRSPMFGGGYLAQVQRDDVGELTVVVSTPRTPRTVFTRRT